jgi:hypothetical protein
MGEPESLLLKDSVATDLRAAGRSEMNREPLVVHIPWLEDWQVPRTDVRDVIADSFRIIQVPHRPLTLLLYGWELFQFVTLRYCRVQADTSDTVRVTLYWRVFVQTCQVSQFLGSALIWGLLHGYGENLPPGGNAAALVVHSNISLTINIALSETVTEFSAFIRRQ